MGINLTLGELHLKALQEINNRPVVRITTSGDSAVPAALPPREVDYEVVD